MKCVVKAAPQGTGANRAGWRRRAIVGIHVLQRLPISGEAPGPKAQSTCQDGARVLTAFNALMPQADSTFMQSHRHPRPRELPHRPAVESGNTSTWNESIPGMHFLPAFSCEASSLAPDLQI